MRSAQNRSHGAPRRRPVELVEQTDAGSSIGGWISWRLAACVLAVVLTASLLTLFLVPWLLDYYTDGVSIRQTARESLLREILWEPPRILTGAINASSENYEPSLSADGLTMVFTRGRARHNADLYQTRWSAAGWSDPEPLERVNTADDELGPELSRDGRYLYFYSNRPGGYGGYDLWVARWNGAGWSPPENLGEAINSAFNEYGPALTADGMRLFFSSNRLRRELTGEERNAWQATLRELIFAGDYDIFCALLDVPRVAPASPAPAAPREPTATIADTSSPADQQPEGATAQEDSGTAEGRTLAAGDRGLPPLPEIAPAQRVDALSSPGHDGQVAFAPHGDFVYFASNRDGGMGAFDIYRARLFENELLPAENMSAPVNGPFDDMDPSLILEGHGLLFSSNRMAKGETRPFQLYRTVSREVICRKNWSGLAGLLRLLDEIKWPLLLLLLGLLALVLLLRYLASRQFRVHASLVQRCLLASLLLHLLLALLLSSWIVGSALYDMAGSGEDEFFLDTDALAGERLGLDIREDVAALEPARDSQVFEMRIDTLAALDQEQPIEPTRPEWQPAQPPDVAAEWEPQIEKTRPIENAAASALARAEVATAYRQLEIGLRPRVMEEPEAPEAVAERELTPASDGDDLAQPVRIEDRLVERGATPLMSPPQNLPTPSFDNNAASLVTGNPLASTEIPAETNELPRARAEAASRTSNSELDARQPVRLALEVPDVSGRPTSPEPTELARPTPAARRNAEPEPEDEAAAGEPKPPQGVSLPLPEMQSRTDAPQSLVAELNPTRSAVTSERDRAEELERNVPPAATERNLPDREATNPSIVLETPRKTAPPRSRREARSDERKMATLRPDSSSAPTKPRAMLEEPSVTRPVSSATARDPLRLDPLPFPEPAAIETLSAVAIDPRPSEPPPEEENAITRFEHTTPRTYHGLEMTCRKVVFCLDVSQSMEWNDRIGDAREELLRLIDTLDDTVEFNIVTFSGAVRVWNGQGVQPATTDNIFSAKRFVRRVRIASDGTNTMAALSVALAHENVKSIYFLSDGHPTVGYTTETDRILALVEEMQEGRQIAINTIAYVKGDPPQAWRNDVPPKERLIDLMERLAESNNGRSVVIE